MIIVIDTNVLVSGLLTPFGSSGEIVRMISSDKLILEYDSRILIEYAEIGVSWQKHKYSLSRCTWAKR